MTRTTSRKATSALWLVAGAFLSTAATRPVTAQSAGLLAGSNASAQQPALNPLTVPTLSPGVVELIRLEGEFSDAVTKGGGKAFASWFAEDGVTLNNGKPAVLGRTAIAATAAWDPQQYHLSWYAEGAQMGPSGDTGFTWGHYDAVANEKSGQPVTLSGRYITFWKKVGGIWKVALDASANDAPAGSDCCSLPKP